jgi:hypothetical protein
MSTYPIGSIFNQSVMIPAVRTIKVCGPRYFDQELEAFAYPVQIYSNGGHTFLPDIVTEVDLDAITIQKEFRLDTNCSPYTDSSQFETRTQNGVTIQIDEI